MHRLGFVIALGIAAPAHAGWFGPSDRDECLIEAAKNSTAQGVRLAASVCYRKFPPTKRDCEIEAKEWHSRQAQPDPIPAGASYWGLVGLPDPEAKPPVDRSPQIGHCPDTYPAMFN